MHHNNSAAMPTEELFTSIACAIIFCLVSGLIVNADFQWFTLFDFCIILWMYIFRPSMHCRHCSRAYNGPISNCQIAIQEIVITFFNEFFRVPHRSCHIIPNRSSNSFLSKLYKYALPTRSDQDYFFRYLLKFRDLLFTWYAWYSDHFWKLKIFWSKVWKNPRTLERT